MRQPTHPRKRTHIPSNRWDKLSSSPNHSHFPGPTERKKNKEGSGFRLVMNALPKKTAVFFTKKRSISSTPKFCSASKDKLSNKVEIYWICYKIFF